MVTKYFIFKHLYNSKGYFSSRFHPCLIPCTCYCFSLGFSARFLPVKCRSCVLSRTKLLSFSSQLQSKPDSDADGQRGKSQKVESSSGAGGERAENYSSVLTAIALWHCPHRWRGGALYFCYRSRSVRGFPGLMACKKRRGGLKPGGKPQLIFTFVLRFPTAENEKLNTNPQ